MAQLMRPISTVTDGGTYSGASAHGSVDGTAPDTGDYWNGNDNQTDVLEVLLTDLSASEPGAGTCTVSIYETVSDTDSAPAAGGGSVTYDLEVYQLTTQIAARTGITPTDSTFTLDSNLTFAASAVTDWADVRVRFTSYGTGGAPSGRRGAAVSYIDISTPDASVDVEVTTTAPQALILTENTATLTHDVNITTTAPQALILTEQTATVAFDVNVTTTAPQALVLTEQTATITHDVAITTNAPQALSITEQTATLVHDVAITTGSPQALSITTYTATVEVGAAATEITTTAPQALVLTEQPATITHDVGITATPQALVLTENTATLTHNVGISASVDALTLATYSTTVSHPISIAAGVKTMTLTTNKATVSHQAQAQARERRRSFEFFARRGM